MSNISFILIRCKLTAKVIVLSHLETYSSVSCNWYTCLVAIWQSASMHITAKKIVKITTLLVSIVARNVFVIRTGCYGYMQLH